MGFKRLKLSQIQVWLTLLVRDELKQDSDIMLDQPRAIDNQRITSHYRSLRSTHPTRLLYF